MPYYVIRVSEKRLLVILCKVCYYRVLKRVVIERLAAVRDLSEGTVQIRVKFENSQI